MVIHIVDRYRVFERILLLALLVGWLNSHGEAYLVFEGGGMGLRNGTFTLTLHYARVLRLLTPRATAFCSAVVRRIGDVGLEHGAAHAREDGRNQVQLATLQLAA